MAFHKSRFFDTGANEELSLERGDDSMEQIHDLSENGKSTGTLDV